MTMISMATTLTPMRGLMHALKPWWRRAVERPADAVGSASADDTTAYQVPVTHGRLRSFTRPHGLSMRCVRGTLWITVDGELADHVLAAGETFEPTSERRVLVYALEHAVLRVQPAAHASQERPATHSAHLHAGCAATRPRLVVQADPQ